MLVTLAFGLLLTSTPPALEPWVPWVLESHPDLNCATVNGQPACAWPGALALDVTETGARFELRAGIDRAGHVRLPGDTHVWPQSVVVDNKPGTVGAASDGAPIVFLSAGQHTIRGRFDWQTMPRVLAIPRTIARFDLTVDGAAVPRPEVDGSGRVLLSVRADVDASTTKSVRASVIRRLDDGIPLRVTTVVELDVSGPPQRVRFESLLLDGTVPIDVTSELPVTMIGNGLDVFVRPGAHTVTVRGLIGTPQAMLVVPPSAAGVTTAREIWVWVADPSFRSVEASGLPAVDASQVSVPGDWPDGLVFSGAPGETLTLEEVVRGEVSAPPNVIKLNRNLWLDFDGRGYTVVDRLSGRLHSGWRLDYGAEGHLGRVTRLSDHRDLSVTDKNGKTGVELRSANLDVQAVIRLEDALSNFAIVGWDHDVQELTVELNAPPGWALLAASGADHTSGTWVDSWSLYDLFFVVILVLAAWRVHGPAIAAVAAVTLVLSHGDPTAPRWIWVNILASTALIRAARSDRPRAFRYIAMGYRAAALVGLAFVLTNFVEAKVQHALYPQTIDTAAVIPGVSSIPKRPSSLPVYRGASSPMSYGADVAQVVQTGPGVQNWSWKQWSLTWIDPVDAAHRVHLVWLSPLLHRTMSVVAALLSIVLAFLLLPVARQRNGWLGAAFAFAVVLLPSPASAESFPPGPMLDELASRLAAERLCVGPCVVAPDANLEIVGRTVSMRTEVSAQRAAGWFLPGPTSVVNPGRVAIDGRETTSLRREPNGMIAVRVPKGRHVITMTGQLAEGAVVAVRLDPATKPKRISVTTNDWRVDGISSSGAPDDVLRMTRIQTDSAPAAVERSAEARSWFTVERRVIVHLPWRVHTVVRRDRADRPDVVMVPLLADEKISGDTIRVKDGAAIVDFVRGATEVGFESRLPTGSKIVLTAPKGRPWTEQWTVECSELWNCTFTGLAPTRSVSSAELFEPTWTPWPGESVTVSTVRPAGAPGETITIDEVVYEVRPGPRLLQASVDMEVLSSRGGWHTIGVPEEITLQALTVEGAPYHTIPKDGALNVPLRLGRTKVSLRWQQPWAPAFVQHVPKLDLGAPAANVKVRIRLSDQRWLLFPTGPKWGPAVLFWMQLFVLAFAALIIGWLVPLRLRAWERVLVVLAMTQLPSAVLVVVAIGFGAYVLRCRYTPHAWWAFDLAQLTLLGLGLTVAGLFAGAIYANLVFDVDMVVRGVESTNDRLEWFLDRHDGPLSAIGFVSVPMWIWRAAALVISVALLVRAKAWGTWAYQTLGRDGWMRSPPRNTPTKPD